MKFKTWMLTAVVMGMVSATAARAELLAAPSTGEMKLSNTSGPAIVCEAEVKLLESDQSRAARRQKSAFTARAGVASDSDSR